MGFIHLYTYLYHISEQCVFAIKTTYEGLLSQIAHTVWCMGRRVYAYGKISKRQSKKISKK
jgi:hypothetical protein